MKDKERERKISKDEILKELDWENLIIRKDSVGVSWNVWGEISSYRAVVCIGANVSIGYWNVSAPGLVAGWFQPMYCSLLPWHRFPSPPTPSLHWNCLFATLLWKSLLHNFLGGWKMLNIFIHYNFLFSFTILYPCENLANIPESPWIIGLN